MITDFEVLETVRMFQEQHLDVRTITMGISLLDCIDGDLDKLKANIYEKITSSAKDLVHTGREIERKYAIPIVNKRISVTPIALIGAAACKTPGDFAQIAHTLDDAAKPFSECSSAVFPVKLFQLIHQLPHLADLSLTHTRNSSCLCHRPGLFLLTDAGGSLCDLLDDQIIILLADILQTILSADSTDQCVKIITVKNTCRFCRTEYMLLPFSAFLHGSHSLCNADLWCLINDHGCFDPVDYFPDIRFIRNIIQSQKGLKLLPCCSLVQQIGIF